MDRQNNPNKFLLSDNIILKVNKTAFFNVEVAPTGGKTGYLVEYAKTKSIFTSPQKEATKDYVTGRFS